MSAALEMLSRESDTSRAILYALNRWEALALLRRRATGTWKSITWRSSSRCAEVTLGRRNYLFTSADSGGERATAIYSPIGTAKLNGIDAEAYLRTGLVRIAEHPINRIEGLQPWKMTTLAS